MKKSVLVVGGGVAGLAAARELGRHNHSIVVVEAQNRLGGRIHTIHHGNLPIELGAEFIHGESQPLLETVREAQLPVQPVTNHMRVFEHGSLDPADVWEMAGTVFQRINPREPDRSFDEFLAAQAGLEPRVKKLTRHFVEGFNAASASHISTHALLRAEQAADQMNGSAQFRIVPGYSALVGFLAGEIERQGGTILKNAPARMIRWQPKQVDVLIERNHTPDILHAEAVVVALPLGILKSGGVQFEPPLAGKSKAVRELAFGNVVKIIFEFHESFWGGCGFIQAPDQAIPTWWDDPRGPILTGWAGGPHADALLKCSDAELTETGLGILGEIFRVRPVTLRRQLIAAHVWNWAADPHIRGAYSYIPVNCLDLPQVLAAPVSGTLFFAGEATVSDAQTGTVFGALESGLRAAREILGSG